MLTANCLGSTIGRLAIELPTTILYNCMLTAQSSRLYLMAPKSSIYRYLPILLPTICTKVRITIQIHQTWLRRTILATVLHRHTLSIEAYSNEICWALLAFLSQHRGKWWRPRQPPRPNPRKLQAIRPWKPCEKSWLHRIRRSRKTRKSGLNWVTLERY